MPADRLLSVVVTIVDGGKTLERCLAALASQETQEPLDVIVPYDDTVGDVAELTRLYPSYLFLNLGSLPTVRSVSSAGGQHELFDRRRAAGLARARGDLVAVLEDRGVPRGDWAAQVRRAHARLADPVIGGAVENGRDRPLNWAVYFCDFGRYQRPFAEGPRDWVSDVNVCYKRDAIDRTAPLWKERYHEPVVHDALRRDGGRLLLSPDLVVHELRENLRLLPLIRERVAWGRLFAAVRVRAMPAGRRLMLAALTPALPAVLFLRLARMQITKRVTLSRFVIATPAVALLLAAWSAGEFLGYIGAPVARR